MRAMPGKNGRFALKTAQDFQQVFKHGKKIKGQLVTIIYAPNIDDHTCLGMVISKSRVRRAVDRNWVKRIIRESFRMHALSQRREPVGMRMIVLLSSKWDDCLTKEQRAFVWRSELAKLFDQLCLF